MTVTVDPPAPPTPPGAADDESGPPPRAKHTARWIALAVGVVVLLFVALLATRKAATNDRADSPLLGVTAPDTQGPIVGGAGTPGSVVTLSSLRGRYAVVNFFASWCVPCQEEQADLVAFNQAHAATGDASVFGIVFDDKAKDVSDFLSQHGGNWPVIDDSDAKVDWGVRGVPETFIVDPNGTVLFHFVGGVKSSELDAALRDAKQVQQQP